MNSNEVIVNLVIIGQTNVGKTCLVNRFIKDTFTTTVSTVGMDFQKTVMEFDGVKASIRIWDTAGMERYASITKSCYTRADGVLIVFDLTSRASFNSLDLFIDKVKKFSPKNSIVIICGNKTDLHDQRVIEEQEAIDFAKANGMPYYEVSCKLNDNKGVESVMGRLSKETFEIAKRRKEENDRAWEEHEKIHLENRAKGIVPNKEKKCCGLL